MLSLGSAEEKSLPGDLSLSVIEIRCWSEAKMVPLTNKAR
jgi:hypothetical protein